MIVDDLTAALPELRAQAESMMVDACVVTVPGAGSGVWDDSTGTYVPPAGSTVYTGRCRVQVPNLSESTLTAGEVESTVQEAVISLPIGGSESVRVGATVVITDATFDADLIGVVYTVTASHHKTFATARRLRCKEETGA